MDTQTLKSLREILGSTRYLLQHYESRTDGLTALRDVQQSIDTALRQIDSVLTGTATAD